MKTLTLYRLKASMQGVLGILLFPDNTFLFTVERPWLWNQKNVSCIPDGKYILRKRQSSVVSKTTKGKYKEGWEVCAVPDRSEVMIHIANTMNDLEGCIGVGMVQGELDNLPAVLSSAVAFDIFMKKLEGSDWRLEIINKFEDYKCSL